MVIIGDQIETDIRGANGFGIDSVLIETGISQTNTADLPQVLQPTYRMSKL
jgi:ribonucleotide monophosphatase NagD (HAD superfamily)